MQTTFDINPNYLNALSRIFTPLVLDSVAEKGHSSYLTEVCSNSLLLNKIDMDLPFAEFLNRVYNFLFKNYRNEYIYKNVLANKILIGKHSLNTAQMLTEFRVGKCKADAVILNGTSTVYEIKSEYDSFNRLKNQLNAYMQVFDHINVITSKQQAEKLLCVIPEMVGILIVTGRNTISTLREAISNKKNIAPEVLFDSMRKNEYLKVIDTLYGAVPNVPNTQIFRECKRLYSNAAPEVAHDVTMAELKKRIETKPLANFLRNAPDSLSAYIISNANNGAKLQALSARLSTNIGTILSPV